MSNVTSIVEKLPNHRDSDSVAFFLSHSLRRPLSILIDSANIAQLALASDDPVQQLSAEIALWREALGSREIASIELRFCEKDIATHDVTRLIHDIASKFKLIGCEWKVVFPCGSVQSSALALLKGLGFSSCQFEVKATAEADLKALADSVRNARAFRFNKVGLQIVESNTVEELTKGIRQLQKYTAPDYLFIGTSTHKLSQIQFAKGATLFEDDLSDIYCDVLKIGPAAVSEIQNRRFNTLSDSGRYADAISRKQLPLVQCCTNDCTRPI